MKSAEEFWKEYWGRKEDKRESAGKLRHCPLLRARIAILGFTVSLIGLWLHVSELEERVVNSETRFLTNQINLLSTLGARAEGLSIRLDALERDASERVAETLERARLRALSSNWPAIDRGFYYFPEPPRFGTNDWRLELQRAFGTNFPNLDAR